MHRPYLLWWWVLSLLLFSTHVVGLFPSSDVRPNTSSLDFLSFGPFIEVIPCLFQELFRISYKEHISGFYLLNASTVAELGSVIFSRWSKILLFFLFSLTFPIVWGCPHQVFPSISNFPFLQTVWCFSDLAVVFLPLFVFFRFLLFAWHVFLCHIPFLYPDYIFLYFVSISNSLPFLANNFMSSLYIRWLFFSHDSVNMCSPLLHYYYYY